MGASALNGPKTGSQPVVSVRSPWLASGPSRAGALAPRAGALSAVASALKEGLRNTPEGCSWSVHGRCAEARDLSGQPRSAASSEEGT